MPGRRIVLLEMNTEDAEEFVRDVANTERESMTFVPPGTTVEAVVARPTKWCTCDVPQESKSVRRRRMAKRESGWVRGSTFGWWLCINCKRPSKPVVIHWVDSMLAGANDLLPVILGTGKAITPGMRWFRDGVENPYANTNIAHNKTLAGNASRRSVKRARNPRRSDVDRKAAMARRNADLARRSSPSA